MVLNENGMKFQIKNLKKLLYISFKKNELKIFFGFRR